MMKYKRKVEKKDVVEEDTKRSPKAKKAAKTVIVSGPRWEKKADLERKKEVEAALNASKEQKRIRQILSDIFEKVDDGKGIEEDELSEAIQQGMNRNKKKKVSELSQNAQNALEKSANDVILAMKSGFLAEDYSVELDKSYGTRENISKRERKRTC